MLVYENRPSKTEFFLGDNFNKSECKNEFKTKNHESDPEIGFLKKSIVKSYGRATAMPTALELKLF